MSVGVNHDELNNPILYINKDEEGVFVHRIKLTPEQVMCIFK